MIELTDRASPWRGRRCSTLPQLDAALPLQGPPPAPVLAGATALTAGAALLP